MIALLNKSGLNHVDELRLHCSFIDADLKYDKISGHAEYESEKIRQIIGDAMYQRALTHYQSANYNLPAEADATLIILNRLVYLIQAPVCNFCYLSWAPHNDINQTGNGRTIHVSEDTKPAFQWQVEKSEQALHKTAHRQVDQLLAYLEEKRDTLTEWRDSNERKVNFDLFISSADLLDRIFPIDKSRWLYLLLSPFLREYQEDTLLAILGTDRYTALSTKLKGTTALDAADTKLLKLCTKPMGLYAVSLGLKRLSLKFFPSGIVQGYTSERMTIKATAAATEGQRYRLADELKADADTYTKVLENHITDLEAAALPVDTTIVEETPEDPSKSPYFSP